MQRDLENSIKANSSVKIMKCQDWHKAECCDVLFSNLAPDRNDLQPAEAEKTAFRTAF